MKLENIVKGYEFEILQGNLNINITGIEQDSRKIEEGDMFIAIKGFTVDGHNYIKEAVEKGTACIVVEDKSKAYGDDVTILQVEDSQLALAKFSSNFYGNPTKKTNLIGVTGTNGKTSITYLLESIFKAQGDKTGIIGTMGTIVDNRVVDNINTTPDSLTINKFLKEMVDVGTKYCIMEASSHALDLKRVEYMDFQTGIFTNLSEDHLDYHITMEEYFKSKLKLFNRTKKFNIINIDDPYGERILREAINNVNTFTYSIDKKGDVFATDIVYGDRGVSFVLNTQDKTIPINLNLLGKFSVYNALAAATAAIAHGVELDLVKKGLENVEGIKGRFELVPNTKDFTVIIDFAHTPDGLEKVLTTIKQFAKGRIVALFGAGGNRDKSKRSIMGEVAGRYADLAIITSDNPRYEDPDEIIKDIIVGVEKVKGDYVAITDRREAIEYAIKNAKPNDIILLAGKGHETYTIIKDEIIPFDEKEIVLDILNNM